MRIRRYLTTALLLGIVTGCAGKKASEGDPEVRMPGELAPDPGKLDVPVPDRFRVKFETTKGDFVVEVTKDVAPIGASHFYRAVDAHFYDGCRFFRVVPGFVVQWGINGDPKVQKQWRDHPIQDEPVKMSNRKGAITYAKGGKDSRTTQVFINLRNNSQLDNDGFSAFGKVISGMDVVENINSEYGERPDQKYIQSDGNEYLKSKYPRLDYIKQATILKAGETGTNAGGKKKTGTAKTGKKAGKK
jgi:cyclophilin family peptidyl-prolyl cis-trans isomerase